jgi:tRNA(fMet)-specific endonuclease VapC
LRYGVAKRGSAKLRSRVSEILQIIPVLALDQPVDEKYGLIRAELEATGQPIGMNDLLIAAHAMTLGLTLVTDNTREFSRVSGLKIENWLVR